MATTATRDAARRGFWLRQLHRWHWISSAASLAGLLLFAITGFTLNHAGAIEAEPVVMHRELTVPAPVLADLAGAHAKGTPLPPAVRAFISRELGVEVGTHAVEWSDDEAYVSLPRPGGDAWLSIDRADGTLQYERTDRGWIAYLNDLHKGRNAGPLWAWFIDLFALACVIFAVTGFVLLKLHAANRPGTWTWLSFGALLPVLLALLFVH